MSDPQEFIDNIINNAITTAEDFTSDVSRAANVLIASNGGEYIEPPSTAQDFTIAAKEPTIPTATDTTHIFQAEMARIQQLLTGQIDHFIATYYPLSSAFDGANGWLVNTITNGGTGLNLDFAVPPMTEHQTDDTTDTTLDIDLAGASMAGDVVLPVPTQMTRGSLVSADGLGTVDTSLTNISIDNVETGINVDTSIDLSDLTSPGIGVGQDAFDQVWQRARERIIADGRRTEDQLVTGYASRGYSLVPGQMLQMLHDSRASQLAAIGAAATDIAAKQVQFSLEIAKLEKEIIERRHEFQTERLKLEADIQGKEIGFNVDIERIKASADIAWKKVGYDISLATKKADLEIEVARLDLDRQKLNADIEAKEIAFNIDIAAKQVEFDLERAKLGSGTARIELERQAKKIEFDTNIAEKNSKFKLEKERLITDRAELDAKRASLEVEIYKVEAEMVKFAVEKAMDVRRDALAAAGDYIKTMTVAPDVAVKVAALSTDVQAKMMSAAGDFYRARLNRDELVLKSKLAKVDADLEVFKAQSTVAQDRAKTNMQGLNAAADAYARTASSALASLNGIVSTGVSAFA